MKTYFVHLNAFAITVRTDETIETLTFRTKKQADKKLMALIADGYKFDRYGWEAHKESNPYAPKW